MSDSLQPVDCSPPSSSIHGILQARILEWATLLQLKKQADKRTHSLIKIKCWGQRRVVGEVGLEATTRGRLFLLGQQTPGRVIEQPLLLLLDPNDPASLTTPHFQPFCLSVSRCLSLYSAPSVVFSKWFLRRFSYLSLLFFGTLHSDEYIFPFLLCFLFLPLNAAIYSLILELHCLSNIQP